MLTPELKDIFKDMLELHSEDKQDPRLSDCIFREDISFIILIELMKELLGTERYQSRRVPSMVFARAIAQYMYGCEPSNPHSYTHQTLQKLFDNIIQIIRFAQTNYVSMYPSFKKEYTELGLTTMEIWLTGQYLAGSHRQRLENLKVWCEAHIAPFLDGITHPGYGQKLYKEYMEAVQAITSSEEQWKAEYYKYQKDKQKRKT